MFSQLLIKFTHLELLRLSLVKWKTLLKQLVRKPKNLINSDDKVAFSTFEILSGSDAGKIFRVQIGSPENDGWWINPEECKLLVKKCW